VQATPDVLGAACARLKEAGFRSRSTRGGESDNLRKLQPMMDVIKVDIHHMPSGSLAALTPASARLEAEAAGREVETVEDSGNAWISGFEYSRVIISPVPALLSGKKNPRPRSRHHELAESARSRCRTARDRTQGSSTTRWDDEPAAPGEHAGRGRALRINSVGHALIVLGRRQLQRWLQILLYVKSRAAAGLPVAPAADGHHARQDIELMMSTCIRAAHLRRHRLLGRYHVADGYLFSCDGKKSSTVSMCWTSTQRAAGARR